MNRYGVQPGARAVVFTNNDSAYRTALRLADAQASKWRRSSIARPTPRGELPERVRKAGIDVIASAVVVDVRGSHGASRAST